MMAVQHVAQAWAAFHQQARIERPTTAEEYETLLELMHHITDQMEARAEDVETSLYAPLFDLVAMYLHDWEKQHEPEVESSPTQSIRFLMQQHGLTQNQLAMQLGITQSHISKVLSSQRAIGKALAIKLGQRFGLPIGVFLETKLTIY